MEIWLEYTLKTCNDMFCIRNKTLLYWTNVRECIEISIYPHHIMKIFIWQEQSTPLINQCLVGHSSLRERPKFIGTWGWCFSHGVVTFFTHPCNGVYTLFRVHYGVYTFFQDKKQNFVRNSWKMNEIEKLLHKKLIFSVYMLITSIQIMWIADKIFFP